MPAIRFYKLRDKKSARYRQYRTAILFEKNFKKLNRFIKIYGRYPEKGENGHLYTWISSQRSKKKNNSLEDSFEQKLDSISFIWNPIDVSWNKKLDDIKRLLRRDNNLTLYEMDSGLFLWLKRQKKLSIQNLLRNERKQKLTEHLLWIEEVSKKANRNDVLKGPNLVKKHSEDKYLGLLEFRKSNPKRWPSNNTFDLSEKRLSVWCHSLRVRNRRGIISTNIKQKLIEIGFNFNGHYDNWKERFIELESHVTGLGHFPKPTNNLYTWALFQDKIYEQLSDEQKKLWDSLDHNLFPKKHLDWNAGYEKLKIFISKHETLPTTMTDNFLCSWIKTQRGYFQKGLLSKDRERKLLNLGITLAKVDVDARWGKRYNELEEFRKENPNRWPSLTRDNTEKELNKWIQVQRVIYSDSLKNLVKMPQYRIEKLRSLGCTWLDKNK